MARPSRVGRDLKLNKGRIIRVEQLVGRLEQRIEALEAENEALRNEQADGAAPASAKLEEKLTKLSARVDENRKELRAQAQSLTELEALREPVRALVRSFKQTPGAPFPAWTTWMLQTFRKQGVYRKKLFR